MLTQSQQEKIDGPLLPFLDEGTGLSVEFLMPQGTDILLYVSLLH